MSATLQVMNLTKSFDSFIAVDNISFAAVKGEVVGLLGPNGAGKSTTMKMITGFLTPTSGTVHIGGYDIKEQPQAARTLLGYLPEGAPAYSDMRVRDFLKFIADIRGVKCELHNFFDLHSVLDKKIEHLSKGFKKRVGLAQALLHNPSVVILDEPTDGLDPIQKKDVRDFIKEIARDKVVLLSTHLLEEAEIVCDRVIIIARGKIVLDGISQKSELEQTFANLEVSHA